MKNINKSAVFLAFLTALSAAGCASKTGSAVSDEVVTENVTEATVDPHSVVFDWQKLYEDKLKEFASSGSFVKYNYGTGSMFDLHDLDGDGSPELIISAEPGADLLIYTVSGGNLTEITSVPKGEAFYIPQKNAIEFRFTAEDFVIGEYDTLDGGSFSQIVNYYDNSRSAAKGGAITYMIDHEEVLYPEFLETLSEYSDPASLKLGRKYSFGDSSIDYALYVSESWGAVLSRSQKDAFMKTLSEYPHEAGDDTAFEIADLNGDSVPELVISEGEEVNSACHVFRFSEDGSLSEAGEGMGNIGHVIYDIETRDVLVINGNSISAVSLESGEFSDYSFSSMSDSVFNCGRGHILCDEELLTALN